MKQHYMQILKKSQTAVVRITACYCFTEGQFLIDSASDKLFANFGRFQDKVAFILVKDSVYKLKRQKCALKLILIVK